MESYISVKRMGNYSTQQAGLNENCSICHNADFADVLLNGICGRCLLNFYHKNKAMVHSLKSKDYWIEKEKECLDCGWIGKETDLVSRHPCLKECDYEYCPECESDNILDYEERK